MLSIDGTTPLLLRRSQRCQLNRPYQVDLRTVSAARGWRFWFLRAFSWATNCDSIGAEFFPKTTLVKLEYVRLSVGVKFSPQQSKVRPVLLLNLYLEIHFFYIASDTNRVSTKTNQDVKRPCSNFGPAWIMSFREIRLHLAAHSTFVVALSILTTGKCGKYHTLFGSCSSA